MKRLIPAVLAIVAATAVQLAARPARPDKPAEGASFKKGPYTLVITELAADSELDLTGRGKNKHTVSLTGALTAREKVDAVGRGEAMRCTVVVLLGE